MVSSSFCRIMAIALFLTNGCPAVWSQPSETPTAPGDMLQNGDFRSWEEGRPVHWIVEIGASNGEGPESILEAGPEGGLVLSGNGETLKWKFLSQELQVKPGDSWRVQFVARSQGVRREGHQFQNCYVGYMLEDASGQRIDIKTIPVVASRWRPVSLTVVIPEGAATLKPVIFLSQTGQLFIRNASVRSLRGACNFQLLVDDMARHYSYFALRKIDWPSHVRKYEEKANAAKTPREFAKAIYPMLKSLRDPHITIQLPNDEPVATFPSTYRGNYDFGYVRSQLSSPQTIGRSALVGRTKEGFGYAAIASLSMTDDETKQVQDAIRGLFETPGVLIDLRKNSGGSEVVAQQIAGMFLDQPVLYAKHQFRSGPGADEFTEPHERMLLPTGDGPAYKGPVVCLSGPGAISSGEAFVLMMKALPQGTVVGLPTRGASGNPAPLLLPNKVTVLYSRWRWMSPDGDLLEGKGVAPDVVVRHPTGKGDPTFDKAIEILKASRATP